MDRKHLLRQRQLEMIRDLIPVGRENAISSREITLRTGIGERSIQKYIEELRYETNELPIVAAMEAPFGYYIPRSQEEAAEWERQMEARIASLCKMRNCVRRAYRMATVGDQYALKLG